MRFNDTRDDQRDGGGGLSGGAARLNSGEVMLGSSAGDEEG